MQQDTELEEDFNPTEYDRKMQELFDEEFYDKMDDEKPVFDEEEDEFIVSVITCFKLLLVLNILNKKVHLV